MASASTRQDQKQDLQSLLECSICLETFDDPRTLPCLHSFCKKCLENFVNGKRDDDLNCPVCRTKFMMSKEGVSGMTRNHFICNMVEVMCIQKQDKCIPCSHCQEPSVGRCVTCELFMCEKCFKPHNEYPGFQDHVVLTMEELSKPENQSKIRGRSYCKKHASKKLKLYCETCEELICTYCMAFEHARPGHLCSPLEEVAQKKRNDLMLICYTLEDNDEYSKFQINIKRSLNTCKINLAEAKRKIDERKTEVLRFVKNIIEKKSKFLSGEMDTIYQNKLQEIKDQTVQRQGHFKERKKTLNMANALLEHGSDEEIVISHKSLVEQNATKDHQWNEANVDIMQYDSDQLDTLFLDDVRAIGKDIVLGNSEVLLTNEQQTPGSSASTREELLWDQSTRKLMVVNKQLCPNNDLHHVHIGPICNIGIETQIESALEEFGLSSDDEEFSLSSDDEEFGLSSDDDDLII